MMIATMTWDAGISLVFTIASVVLAVVAIWLSFKFYELSEKSAQRTETASREIHSAVDRLEKLFEMQYSDTFSMVRETYADFRRRLLDPSGMAEERAHAVAQERAQQLKVEVTRQIDELVTTAAQTNPKTLKNEVDKLAGTIVDKSMAVDREARYDAAKEEVTAYFSATWSAGARWRVGAIATHFRERIPLPLLLQLLRDFKAAGILVFENASGDELTAETQFSIRNPAFGLVPTSSRERI